MDLAFDYGPISPHYPAPTGEALSTALHALPRFNGLFPLTKPFLLARRSQRSEQAFGKFFLASCSPPLGLVVSELRPPRPLDRTTPSLRGGREEGKGQQSPSKNKTTEENAL
jgi:hypothetical protein